MTVGEALALARRLGVARLDAQLLLGHMLRRDRSWLIAHDEAALDDTAREWFEQALAQRRDDVPLAYLVGQREFHGLTLEVGPGVLVPRPETEVLVDWALSLLGRPVPGAPPPRVVDLGTGSGAIALALRHRAPWLQVTAVDRSTQALEIARRNAERLGLTVEFVAGSWWQGLSGRRFDLAVSNPPYVASQDPHLQALRHEPLEALTPGGDGLSALHAIIDGAPAHLVPGGWLLLEHGHDQAPMVRRHLQATGFVQCETRQDLAGLPRCTGGRWPGAVGQCAPGAAAPGS